MAHHLVSYTKQHKISLSDFSLVFIIRLTL